MTEERRAIVKQLIKEAVKIINEEVEAGLRCSECPLLDTCEVMFRDCVATWEVE
jgi:CRISPR/Cas system-associated exonuclease Cas4 (RecB family)